MSRKKYTIRKAPYAHLDFTMRLTPEKAWNGYVRGNLCISVRFFARLHGIKVAVETIVNSIHRRSLKGETAYDCHSRLAKTL